MVADTVNRQHNKVCLFELSRFQQVALGYCSTDAKSCYDRIVHSFASLAMRKWGVPKFVALTMFDVISLISHFVQTGFGVSSASYSHPPEELFQGVGQGKGAGPAIWAAVSAPLLEYLDSRDRGVTFHSSLSQAVVQISALAFVDDTDVVVGIPEGESCLHDDIIQRLTEQVKDWSGVLRVSGGAIVPEKSFYWILNYVNGKPMSRSSGPPIAALGSDGNAGQIPFLSASESRRTLGMLINPTGTWTAQRDKMRLRMERWAEASRIASLSRSDAMMELRTRVIPKLLYGLSATSFHARDCRCIMAPAVKVGLNLCGTVRTLPHSIVFGQEELLGLGVHDIYMAQGLSHLQALALYGPMDQSLTGKLIRGLMGQAVVTVGLRSSVLSSCFPKFGQLLPNGWVKTLWRFCSEFNIQVDDWLPGVSLLRENDRYIMQCAIERYSDRDTSSISSVNRCRLFLKLVTFGNGRTLMERFLHGNPQGFSHRSIIQFAPSHPTAADWSVWRSFRLEFFPYVQRWVDGLGRLKILVGCRLFIKQGLG